MDSSRRAVESYWRSKMIDGATSDEDKVTPVYKLEEICDLLRSAHVSIVKEVSDFILKRLDHKSPIVKQKALRLIKYAVGKSGVEFRREMQRHSVAVRQLLHYKGEADPLKGDALNKAVRETANEALAAIFSEENNKVAGAAPTVGVNRRIEGFGNTNFHMVTEEKKSFLSEVVDLGSQTIKQGLSSLTQSHSMKKSGDIGSYRSPNLHRNLTAENDDYSSRYEPVQLRNETQSSLGVSRHAGPWGQDSRATTVTTATTTTSVTNGDANSSYAETKTREERLLETIVTSGGVRLQPTRDAIQVFLVEASKMDALALTRALESKLQSPVWQVRMKAVCVLEAILRKKEDEHFSIVYSYFSENKDVVVKCSESPQSSLREKANKVLSLLGSEQAIGLVSNSNKSVKAEISFVQMPDLIDTGDSDDFLGRDDSRKKPSDQKNDNQTTQTAAPLIDDLLGDDFGTVESTREQKGNDDPFADVSFHTSEGKGTLNDLFSGTTVDDKPENNENQRATSNSAPVLFDIFGSNAELSGEQGDSETNVNDLMAGMSISENSTTVKQKESSPMIVPENAFSVSSHPSHQPSNDALTGMLGPQMMAANTNPMFSSGTMPYNIPPGMMLNPAFQAQPINYGSMGSFFAHQQLLATVSNFQHLSNFNGQMASISHPAGSTGGGQTSPIPDIFQANFPNQAPASLMNGSKKEETRAFDFISDHLAAARDPKRVV